MKTSRVAGPTRRVGSGDGSEAVDSLTTGRGIFAEIHGDRAAATKACFLQGVGADCTNNVFVLRALKARFEGRGLSLCVVAIDNLGIGRSAAPVDGKAYGIRRMCRDVDDVLELSSVMRFEKSLSLKYRMRP